MAKEEISHGLINLLLVLLVLGVLMTIAIFILRPTEWLKHSRDAQRVEDMIELAHAVNLYLADHQDFNKLKNNQIYNSLSAKKDLNEDGWLPLNLTSISSGAPFARLPLDPNNNFSYYYRFGVNQEKKTFELDCVLESGINQNRQLTDNGNNPNRYEVGTDLTILK